MKIRINENPIPGKLDEIVFVKNSDTPKNKEKGLGFISKDKQKLGLLQCPKCGKINDNLRIEKGVCYYCNFDIKELTFIG